MRRKIYADFEQAVDAIISVNKTTRAAHPERHKFVPVVEYLAESGTVRVGTGRQTGKSHYAASHAGIDDCIIVPNGDMERSLRELPVRGGIMCDVLRAEDVLTQPTKRYATIYIDEPLFVFRNVAYRDIFTKLAFDADQTFVLLGN